MHLLVLVLKRLMPAYGGALSISSLTLRSHALSPIPPPIQDPPVVASEAAVVQVQQQVPDQQQPTPLEIAIDRLSDMIRRLEVQHRTGGSGFDKEFDLLKMDDLKFYDPGMCAAGFANREKNRYACTRAWI